jgi:hypothetical protein
MVLLKEQNVSLQNKRAICCYYCVIHIQQMEVVLLKRSLKYSDAKWKQYIRFLKQYLCMEDWFHDSNNKVEVINAQPQIAKVL